MTDQTYSVGYVHVLDAVDGQCTETCPHPDHDGPVVVAIPADLKPLLDEWLGNLDLTSHFVSSDPEEFGGLRVYAVKVPADHATRVAPFAGQLRPGNPPRVKGATRR